MTGEQILIALGGVDDALLEACETYRAPRHMPWKALTAAACFALAMLAGTAALHRTRLPATPEPTDTQATQTGETSAAIETETIMKTDSYFWEDSAPRFSQTSPPFETTTRPSETTTARSGAGVYDGKSDETPQNAANEALLFARAPITTKYPSMTWQGKTYMSRGSSDPSAKVQKTILGTAELTGFDGVHKTTVRVLPIGGVSQEAAVAVQFADSDRYYAYVCVSFAPATLGEYLDAFALWDNASFTRVTGCSRKYPAAIYPAPSADVLHSLFDHGAKKANVREDDCPADMSIDCSAPVFGVKGSAFGVTETGYLLCRMTDSTVIYYVGSERAKTFLDTMDAGDATRLVQTTGTDAAFYPATVPQTEP